MLTLVTGGSGFLGRHIIAVLIERGEQVRSLDLSHPEPLPDDVEAVDGSITDTDTLTQAVAGVDAVIHAAAVADLWTPNRFDYHRVNMAGSCRVLAAAHHAGARMVHVSSYVTLIGGDPLPELTLNEIVELTPSQMLGPYPRSKREAELALLGAAAAGQNVVVVMPSAPVGPGDHRMTPPSKMIRDLAAGKTPAILDCLMNMTDVRALAQGIVLARDKGASGQRYLLTGQDLTMEELARKITDLTGTPAPKYTAPLWIALAAARAETALSRLTSKAPTAPLTGVRLAARRRRFNNAKARTDLGYDPGSLDTALADSLEWMKGRGLL